MIEDYKLLNDIEIFFQKKFLIWGAGKRGKELAECMQAYTQQIEFVDTDKTKLGKYCGIPVYQPERIIECMYEGVENYAIILSPDKIEIQESIMEQIKLMGIWTIDIYTRYAIQAVVTFLNNKNVIFRSAHEQKMDDLIRCVNEISNKQRMQEQLINVLLNDQSVFVYQSKKVGSSTIALSATIAGIYGFHVHDFNFLDLNDKALREIIKRTSGKVISIVREPIARQISLLWHYWWVQAINNYSSLQDMENHFYAVPNEEDEFEWYLGEFLRVLDINIYEYFFDKVKGYSIIEKDGISLLLLKSEKLNDCEQVIGDFLGVDNFKLVNVNMANSKPYKYAYQNYLEHVKIPHAFIEHYYSNNRYMDYFYSEEEKNIFYQHWKNRIF